MKVVLQCTVSNTKSFSDDYRKSQVSFMWVFAEVDAKKHRRSNMKFDMVHRPAEFAFFLHILHEAPS